jgi:hypothetical protein
MPLFFVTGIVRILEPVRTALFIHDNTNMRNTILLHNTITYSNLTNTFLRSPGILTIFNFIYSGQSNQ